MDNTHEMPDRAVTPADLAPKEIFLDLLHKLSGYVDDGIRDYLFDNSMEDYFTHGDLQGDLDVVKAISTLRAFVNQDNFPWWTWNA